MQKPLRVVFVILFILSVYIPAHAQEGPGEAYYDFGVFAYEDKDFAGAEQNLLKALEFAPGNPYYNHYLGKTYLQLERYEEALTYLNRAREINPDLPGLTYDTAFLYYKTADYGKAVDLFEAVIKEDPSQVLAVYYAGISSYQLKRFQRAHDYFISAADQSPSLKANCYYYAGICLQKTGKIDQAVAKFEYVRDHAESGLLKENAVKWLAAIESRKAALKPGSLYLKLGAQYDDNVRLEPLDQDLYANEDDWAAVAVFAGRYHVINRADYKVGIGYNHFQTWYDSLEEFDLVGSTVNLYARYRIQPFTVGVSYLPTYYWLDDESYLMRHQIKPELIWNQSDKLTLRLSYSYYRNNYFDSNDRDGHTHEGVADVYYSVWDQKGVLFAGGGYEDTTASVADQYYDMWKARLGLSVKLPWDLDFSVTGKYFCKEYDAVDSVFGEVRKDDKYNVSVSLAHPLFYKWLGVVAECSHTKNDSNISSYDYKRNVFTLSLTAQY